MPIDYSKWNHVEISDDEDDQHPNIDKASLNKWRHEARVQRMQEADQEKKKFEQEQATLLQKKAAMKAKVDAAEVDTKTKEQLAELEKQEEAFRKKEEELKNKERLTPWNIDTICHDGKSKTVINKTKPVEQKPLTDEEKMQKQREFTSQKRDKVKKFGMLRKYEESERCLTDNLDLVCEETANFLTIWCIDLAVEDKTNLMAHVSHQTIVLQFILELSRSLKVDPRACVKPFFARIKTAEKEYLEAFNSELDSFKQRVHERAEARFELAKKEAEEEAERERQARLGPGGLDPVEVMESLPEEMQKCFESKDIGMLQEVVAKMDQKDAAYHIKRCVDSGMWVPGGREDTAEGGEDTAEGGETAEAGLEEATKGASGGVEEEPDYAVVADPNEKQITSSDLG